MKVVLIFLFLGGFIDLFGQRIDVPVFNHPERKLVPFCYDYFKSNYPRDNSLDTLCRIGCTFVKFQVNETGGIDDISCSNNTPTVIAQFFIGMVASTNKYWKPATVNGKSIKSKPIIIPIIFFFIDQCQLESRNNSLETDFWYLTQFGVADKKFNGIEFKEKIKELGQEDNFVDCILYHPIIFSNTFMENSGR